MQRSDFHYDLPPELIAQRPLAARSAARLLCLDGPSGVVADRQIADLVELARPGDLLVFNDTRVIPARLFGHKQSGGRVEVFIERLITATSAVAHVRASKAPRSGTELLIDGNHRLRVNARTEQGLYLLATLEERSLIEILNAVGHVPLPPYIARTDDAGDAERYQTIYARHPGAVAAPTAGLHFDEELLDKLKARGARIAFVTLHVGAGTFQPVRAEKLEDHPMHAEWSTVTAEIVALVAKTKAEGGRVVAIGTTSVRALESAAQSGTLMPYAGDTRLFIYPGYRFQVVDCLLTNFHLPESTLLMLVAAFAGFRPTMAAYRHAVAARYRFFSYGDAMWVTRAA